MVGFLPPLFCYSFSVILHTPPSLYGAILKKLKNSFDEILFNPLQAATAEAGGSADMPPEGAGLSEEVVGRLQDTATVLTQERKRRGRTVPEGLTPAEDIRSMSTLASHPVRFMHLYQILEMLC